MNKKFLYVCLLSFFVWAFLGCESQKQADSISSSLNTQDKMVDGVEDPKILVAYFSATQNTQGVAKTLATQLSGDLYEIKPEVDYTSDDLNYHNSKSRTSLERNDPTSRPAILKDLENFEDYEVIFLGYPIWWGEAPRIMNTFLETYDFSNSIIIPFCTSASSGFGSSDATLQEIAKNATWLEGKRFSSQATAEEIQAWIEELDFNSLSSSTKQ